MIIATKPQKRTIQFVTPLGEPTFFHLTFPAFNFHLIKQEIFPIGKNYNFLLQANTPENIPLPLPNILAQPTDFIVSVCVGKMFCIRDNKLEIWDETTQYFNFTEPLSESSILNKYIQMFWQTTFYASDTWQDFFSTWQKKQYNNWHDILTAYKIL